MTDIPNGATRTARATIAIALIGLFGTSLAAFFQWKSNLEVENKRLEGKLALEEKRFRYELLLRATEPESEQDRRALLKFYHEAGLVDGLEKLIEKYAEEESGFIPRSSGTSGGPVFDSPLNRFLEIASTRDGRRPTVDQRVKEAVRLALLGQSKNIARARMLLAEAGYPSGFTVEIPLDLYKSAGGNEKELETFTKTLFQIGIRVDLKR